MAVAAIGAVRSEVAESARGARLARILALVVDSFVLGIVTLVVNGVFGVERITSGSPTSYSTTTAVDWPWLTLLGIVYFTVPEAMFGASPGKYWARLRVIRVDGKPLDLRSVVIRNVLKPIDWLPILYLLGGLSVLLTANSQRLGDRWAGTTVVYRQRALEPGATRTSSRRAKQIATMVLAAAFLFTLAFNYFGRPALVLEGLHNEHRLMGSDVSSITYGSPQWSWGRVTYPVTAVMTRSGFPCNGSITLEWNAFGWHQGAADLSCRP
jgi:uncharacterized RDD family membrane protein YckC